ncbi:MAG: hypothetical protein Q9170_000650 [Blastenia crenularia]
MKRSKKVVRKLQLRVENDLLSRNFSRSDPRTPWIPATSTDSRWVTVREDHVRASRESGLFVPKRSRRQTDSEEKPQITPLDTPSASLASAPILCKQEPAEEEHIPKKLRTGNDIINLTSGDDSCPSRRGTKWMFGSPAPPFDPQPSTKMQSSDDKVEHSPCQNLDCRNRVTSQQSRILELEAMVHRLSKICLVLNDAVEDLQNGEETPKGQRLVKRDSSSGDVSESLSPNVDNASSPQDSGQSRYSSFINHGRRKGRPKDSTLTHVQPGIQNGRIATPMSLMPTFQERGMQTGSYLQIKPLGRKRTRPLEFAGYIDDLDEVDKLNQAAEGMLADTGHSPQAGEQVKEIMAQASQGLESSLKRNEEMALSWLDTLKRLLKKHRLEVFDHVEDLREKFDMKGQKNTKAQDKVDEIKQSLIEPLFLSSERPVAESKPHDTKTEGVKDTHEPEKRPDQVDGQMQDSKSNILSTRDISSEGDTVYVSMED